MNEREGIYQTWEWDELRRCWVYSVPCRVYPHEDGTFTASYGDVWVDGIYNDFESAEKAALGISTS